MNGIYTFLFYFVILTSNEVHNSLTNLCFDMQQPVTFNVSCSAHKCSTKSVTQQSFSFSLFLLSIGSCVI